MKVKVKIEKTDIDKTFGKVSVDVLAAGIYHAFHGDCECSTHPFYKDDVGEFHGLLPWDEGKPCYDDKVVHAFRLAAVAAYDALKSTGIGHLK